MEQQLFEKCLEMEVRLEKDPNMRTQLRWTHGIYPSFGENMTNVWSITKARGNPDTPNKKKYQNKEGNIKNILAPHLRWKLKT